MALARLSDLIAPREESSVAAGTLDSVFAEEPVPLSVFVQDSAYLKNPPLSPEQEIAVRHIERIWLPETFTAIQGGAANGSWAPETVSYWTEPLRMVNLVTLLWGKGSGKDHICRMASLRVCYLLLCLNNPQVYYGMPEQDSIHTMNVAASRPQALAAFFTPMTRAVSRGWFADKCEPKRNEIEWDKNIVSISGSSEAETQEGLNLMLGIADEVDAFRRKEELQRYQGNSERESSHSAETILDMLRTSASTRFPRTYKNVRISYSRYMGSMITQLADQGRADIAFRGEANSRHYVSGPLPTWRVNPNLFNVPRSIPYSPDGEQQLNDVEVPEVFHADYQDDANRARTMYECRPGRAVATYFSNEAAVRACVSERPQPVSFEYVLRNSGSEVPVWEPDFVLSRDFRPIAGARYALHADLATKHDRAGISMAHVVKMVEYEAMQEGRDGELVRVTEMRPLVKVDFVISFEASVKVQPAREIQLRWARQLAFYLRMKGFGIGLFTYDGWQSLDSIQTLQAAGLEARVESMDRTDGPWKTLRDLMYEGRWTTPSAPRMLTELLSLNRLPNGKVDHPVGGSKDEADAAAGATMGALELGGIEADDGEVLYPGDTTFAVASALETPEYLLTAPSAAYSHTYHGEVW